jgi:hypothetical protein
MEIEIKCSCGTEFNFSEEPVNGGVSSAVLCPICKLDVTRQANEFVARAPSERMSQPHKHSRPGFLGGRRSSKQAAGGSIGRSPDESSAFKLDPTQTVRFVLGGLAAVAVSALCAYGWYELAIYTGFYFGLLAWAIGGVVGLVCRWVVPYGQIGIALIAGVSSGLSIAAGHVLVVRDEIQQLLPRSVEQAYALNETYARTGIALTDDASIRDFLAEYAVKYDIDGQVLTEPAVFGPTHPRNLAFMRDALFDFAILKELPREHQRMVAKKTDPEEISADQVKAFRELEQPALEQFLAGNPSAAEWKATLNGAVDRHIGLGHLFSGSLTPYGMDGIRLSDRVQDGAQQIDAIAATIVLVGHSLHP